MRKKLLILLPILFLAVTVLFFKISAQNRNTGLSVHPSNFDVVLEPAKPMTQKVTLDNLTDQTVTIQVTTKNFTATGEEGSVAITDDDDSTYALAKWIKITPDTVTIPAKKSQEFTFTIEAPENAEPGGHFGSLIFATVPNKDLGTTGAALSQEVASLILARIPGEAKEKAVLESFATEKNFYEFGPVTFTARIKNEGAVHIKPQGEVLITDMFGNKYSAPFDAKNILPGATRRVPAELENKILIGKYTAYIIMGYGNTNQQLSGSTEFYAFPVRYAAGGLVVLVFLFLIRRRLFKAFKALISGK